MPVMTRDWAFCRWLALEYGVIAIPTSPFFSSPDRRGSSGGNLVRFTFCKTDATLEAAHERFARLAAGRPLYSREGAGGSDSSS
jgi:aspartate/methionine/tyrosine aminotransferase